jgi:hypothetical protein
MTLAPTHFADINATARDCLALIADFTPDHAATQILAGIRAILAANPAAAMEPTHAG